MHCIHTIGDFFNQTWNNIQSKHCTLFCDPCLPYLSHEEPVIIDDGPVVHIIFTKNTSASRQSIVNRVSRWEGKTSQSEQAIDAMRENMLSKE